ncbi:MAG: hypothetical protein AB7P12_15475 [Alphaproteobacteria bacterium]
MTDHGEAQEADAGWRRRLPAALRAIALACAVAGLLAAALFLPADSLGSAAAVCPVEDPDWQLVDLPPLECESEPPARPFEDFVPAIAIAALGLAAALEFAGLAMALTLFGEARLYRRVAAGAAPPARLLAYAGGGSRH